MSGYIKQQKAERGDILVLDAGDVMEKGDLVAFRAKSTMMYEAMSDVGYDAIAPGNHDDVHGDAHLVECSTRAENAATLAINLLKTDGTLLFAPSKVFERNGLSIGVIGVFKPRDEGSLDLDATINAIAVEARRLESSTNLIIVVAHLGPKECKDIAEAVPEVDVFVSGHTHQALQRPLTTKEGGALIVQAGSYAEYVGRLELTVDDATGEILNTEGSLVAMDHATIPVDAAMQARFTQLEAELAPEASQHVVDLSETLGMMDLAYLGAEGIRVTAGVDIGFCHVSQIIRDILPAGAADINAVFRTGGQRGYDVVKAELSGREIELYIEGLANSDWGDTQWSGFQGRHDRKGREKVVTTNLERDRMYTVAMPLKEWESRFQRVVERLQSESERIRAIEPTVVDTSFTRGVVALLQNAADSPQVVARRITETSELAD